MLMGLREARLQEQFVRDAEELTKDFSCALPGLACRSSLAMRFPSIQALMLRALQSLRDNPFSGDIVRLKHQPTAWPRIVGNNRISSMYIPTGS